MVFRLPTPLNSLIPPPSAQIPEQMPWRCSLNVTGMRVSDKDSHQTIHVTAVETDGDMCVAGPIFCLFSYFCYCSRADLWPLQLTSQITHGHQILQDVYAWVNRYTPPLCTFMPDRYRDPNLNAVNQTAFRSLSRILFETQTVCIENCF